MAELFIEDNLPEGGKVLLVGDVHGNATQLEKAVRHAKDLGIKVIIQLGDFGIWSTDKPYLNKIEYLLNEWEIELYFIDGNHEDFPRLYEKKILEDGSRYVRDHITYLPRGFRWDWNGISLLALGGASSIDRKLRRPGKSWWVEETLTDEDILTAQSGGAVDIMFTHDSPHNAPNSITDDFSGQLGAMRYFGADVLNECTNHRKLLQEVTDVTIPRLLFHGHYHKWMEGHVLHNDSNNTVGYVRGLDQGLGHINKFTYVLDLNEVKEEIEKLNMIEY